MDINFTQQELNSIHDCLFNALGKDELSNEEIIAYWNMLPADIQADALHYGVSDTPTREDMFTWFQENCSKA